MCRWKEVRKQQEWEQKQCAEMLKKPGEVAIGPIEQTEEEAYVLYMLKTISVRGENYRICACTVGSGRNL